MVHVVLVEAQGLVAMGGGKASHPWPYCKISLGKDKQQSKLMPGTVNPKWRESFDFNWYDEFDNELKISVWDWDVGSKDDLIGR